MAARPLGMEAPAVKGKPSTGRKRGPPKGYGSKFTKAIGQHICERMAEGIPLRQICRDKGLAWPTVYRWIEAHAEFGEAYQRARDIGMDAIAEECLEIANTPMLGVTETVKGDGTVETRREDMLGHRKLQIETRLKLLAKWNPKKYGDRITHTGDPAAPVALVLNGSDVNG